MDWLFLSEYDLITSIAIGSIAMALVTTLILFAYTVGLRVATVAGDRRRERFQEKWRDVFAMAATDPQSADEMTLPALTRHDRTNLLEEWNRARSIVAGSAVDNLIRLAQRISVPQLAAALFDRKRVSSLVLAAQTFGHLRDRDRFDELVPLLKHPNTALSVTAAHSLVEIDPTTGLQHIVPIICDRRDWPINKVSMLLREAGSELISEPLYRAIRSARNDDKTYLLKFAQLIESEARDSLVSELIRESQHTGVLTAALKLVSGLRSVPRIDALTTHETWYVRMHAAKLLGRVGQQEHLALLESLLSDSEWWVRYRAAQSIASLPFLGPNQLRRLQQRQSDPYAIDMLQQAMAEVGLA